MTHQHAFKLPTDQSPFGINHTVSVAEVELATLKNTFCHEDKPVDSLIDLVSHELSYMDFISLFYSSLGGGFCIRLANKHFSPILLTSQSYNSSDNKPFKWNLFSQCLKTYSSKHGVSENMISAHKRILLTKECFEVQSLAQNCGHQNALTWDQTLMALESTGQIKYTGDPDHSAHVIFIIQYQFYSKSLDITIAANLRYKSSIPCYRNIYSNEDHVVPNVYSKVEKNEPSNTSLEPSKIFEKVMGHKKSEKNEKISPAIFNNDDDDTTINSLMTHQLLSALNNDEESENESDEDTVSKPQW